VKIAGKGRVIRHWLLPFITVMNRNVW